MTKKLSARHTSAPRAKTTTALLRDLRALIVAARDRVASEVNTKIVRLYWTVGKRIREDLLDSRRARDVERILASVSTRLLAEFGPGDSGP